LYLQHYIQWRQQKVWRDGALLYTSAEQDIDAIALSLYQQSDISYPKFFKMDILSRVAFLAAEWVLPAALTIDRNTVATVLSTASGCLEVDRKFEESRQRLASPALFVYTLPNIMLGEIDIRHGFKGEQMCTISDTADPAWFGFYVHDLLEHRESSACLCGHVEAAAGKLSATLLWVSKERPAQGSALPFDLPVLEQIFNHA